jgi:hypothetical protein
MFSLEFSHPLSNNPFQFPQHPHYPNPKNQRNRNQQNHFSDLRRFTLFNVIDGVGLVNSYLFGLNTSCFSNCGSDDFFGGGFGKGFSGLNSGNLFNGPLLTFAGLNTAS